MEHEPGALPMLSTALLELWQRRDGRRLRLATYESTGGVRGAVARHAERRSPGSTSPSRTIARGCCCGSRATTARAASSAGASRWPSWTRACPTWRSAAADQRLLTVGAGAVEIAHEALLREWPRLRGWLEEDADGRRLHRHLADAARDWDERGRDPGELYRGARLAAALEWRAGHEAELNRTERAFLDAGRRELHAARARRRRPWSWAPPSSS